MTTTYHRLLETLSWSEYLISIDGELCNLDFFHQVPENELDTPIIVKWVVPQIVALIESHSVTRVIVKKSIAA